MSARSEIEREWHAERMRKLVGTEITHVITTPKGQEDWRAGFRAYNPKTKKVFNVWIQADAEGNGPEFLGIEEEP